MLSFDCNACGEEFEMKMDVTTIYVYDETDFNHIMTVCEHCLKEMVLFFQEARFLMHGYPLVHEPEAPWPIRHLWAQLFDPDNLPPDPREEKSPDDLMDEIVERRFHDWLDHIQPGDFNVST